MKERMTAAEYRALPKKRRHKYGAKKTTVDGIKFDSKAEAQQYGTLIQHRPRTRITNLKVHPEFPLHVKGYEIGVYEADFSFIDDSGHTRVQDVKGLILPLAKWKIAHFEIEYGLKVEIIRTARRDTEGRKSRSHRKVSAGKAPPARRKTKPSRGAA
jgi:hypothetical protein